MFNSFSLHPALRQRRVRVAFAAPKVLYARVRLGPSVTIRPVPFETIMYDILSSLNQVDLKLNIFSDHFVVINS